MADVNLHFLHLLLPLPPLSSFSFLSFLSALSPITRYVSGSLWLLLIPIKIVSVRIVKFFLRTRSHFGEIGRTNYWKFQEKVVIKTY